MKKAVQAKFPTKANTTKTGSSVASARTSSPVPPADPDGIIRASLALWLHLTTADDYTSWDTGGSAEPALGGWQASGTVSSNLSALTAGQQFAIRGILHDIAAMQLPAQVTTMGGAFSAVQSAFQKVMSTTSTTMTKPPYVPTGGHTCPANVSYLSQLQLSYPAATPTKQTAAKKAVR